MRRSRGSRQRRVKGRGSGTFRFGTKAVDAGATPEPVTGAILTPIFQTATYVQPAVGDPKGHHDYSRTANPTRDAAAVASAMPTRLVHVETPTTPMMRVCDIAALAEIAHAGRALLSADNTFASPYGQRPLELGADLSVHPSTKYVNGHSDVIGGIVAVRDEAVAEELTFLRRSTGAVLEPTDCWLTLRALKTLHARMRQHNANGLKVVGWLTAPAEDGPRALSGAPLAPPARARVTTDGRLHGDGPRRRRDLCRRQGPRSAERRWGSRTWRASWGRFEPSGPLVRRVCFSGSARPSNAVR